MKIIRAFLPIAAILLVGCQTTNTDNACSHEAPARKADPAISDAGAGGATPEADKRPSRPTTALNDVGTMDCEQPAHVTFTLAIAGDDTFAFWFKGDVAASDVIDHWLDKLKSFRRIVPGPSYGGIRFDDCENQLSFLRQSIVDVDEDMTFKDAILNQSQPGCRWQGPLNDLQQSLDLGFLNINNATIAQLRTLIEREGLLKDFSRAADAGIGDVSLSQLYSTPIAGNVDDGRVGDRHVLNGVLNPGISTRETDDIGDMLSVLNTKQHRILWTKGLKPCVAQSFMNTGQGWCCCNVVGHTVANNGHDYRTCKPGTSNQYCVHTCLGKCCMATLVWCAPH